MAFPPVPLYPIKLDSDRTLFLVYNTTETRLAVDNQPWSEEIEIEAAASDEIWADNGYGNIGGELFYYDSVSKNDGKVTKLKGCVRNIGGNQTRFNRAGAWVRSYVIAEHHNQLMTAIINLEKYLKEIDANLAFLESEFTCADDFNCTNTNLSFTTEPAEACTGTVANYEIGVTGNYTTATINFGDGETSTNLIGSHIYPPNAVIDPIVMIENESCLTLQTPAERDLPTPWDVPVTPVFSIPLCEIPDIPDINIPSCVPASTVLTFPQIILPSLCLSIPSIYISIPSMCFSIPSIYISIGDISIPSLIVVSVPPISIPPISIPPISIPPIDISIGISVPTISISIPPIIVPSIISIIGPSITIPSQISVVMPSITIPSQISVVMPSMGIPSQISVIMPSTISITIPSGFPSTISIIVPSTWVPIPPTISIIPPSTCPIPPTISIIPPSIGIPPTISIICPPGDCVPPTISIVTPSNWTPLPPTISIVTPSNWTPLPPTISIVTPSNWVPLPSGISIITPSNWVPLPSGVSIIMPSGGFPSQISVTLPGGGGSEWPPISVTCDCPDLTVDWSGAPTISVTCNCPDISVTWGPTPTLNVTWDSCDCTITVSCAPAGFAPQGVQPPAAFTANMETFEDNPNAVINMKPITQGLGIPSEIKLLVPEFKKIEVQHDLPSAIQILSPNIPSVISIQSPEAPLPREIKIVGTIPSAIKLNVEDLPKSIKIDGSTVPTSIELRAINLPRIITIDASDIPDKIQVTGIPSAIELKGQIPSEIFLKVPENLEVPLVYRGGPVPIQFNLGTLADPNTEDQPCFAITPCQKR